VFGRGKFQEGSRDGQNMELGGGLAKEGREPSILETGRMLIDKFGRRND